MMARFHAAYILHVHVAKTSGSASRLGGGRSIPQSGNGAAGAAPWGRVYGRELTFRGRLTGSRRKSWLGERLGDAGFPAELELNLSRAAHGLPRRVPPTSSRTGRLSGYRPAPPPAQFEHVAWMPCGANIPPRPVSRPARSRMSAGRLMRPRNPDPLLQGQGEG